MRNCLNTTEDGIIPPAGLRLRGSSPRSFQVRPNWKYGNSAACSLSLFRLPLANMSAFRALSSDYHGGWNIWGRDYPGKKYIFSLYIVTAVTSTVTAFKECCSCTVVVNLLLSPQLFCHHSVACSNFVGNKVGWTQCS